MDGSQSPLPSDTRRRRFSAADVQIMLETGVLKDREKVELIGGELVEMSPQGPLHWDVTHLVSRWLRFNLPRHLDYASQGPFRLGDFDEPEPEFFIFPDGMNVNAVRGEDVLLVIEVAMSSLSFDLNVKSSIYSRYGVREYWVIDVEGARTVVHTLSAERRYAEPREVAFTAPLTFPGGLELIIADLAPKA